jgi:hypothetical protein
MSPTRIDKEWNHYPYEVNTKWTLENYSYFFLTINVFFRVKPNHKMRSSELQEYSVIRKFRITVSDGKNYLTSFYHLDAIIAVGYRVNSYLCEH